MARWYTSWWFPIIFWFVYCIPQKQLVKRFPLLTCAYFLRWLMAPAKNIICCQFNLGSGFKYFLFSPLPGEMIQFDEHIFQMGWFNPRISRSLSLGNGQKEKHLAEVMIVCLHHKAMGKRESYHGKQQHIDLAYPEYSVTQQKGIDSWGWYEIICCFHHCLISAGWIFMRIILGAAAATDEIQFFCDSISCWPSSQLIPHTIPWDWYIYLHEWLVFNGKMW